MKKVFAIFVAKQAGFWSRVFGRGGGAALPGLIAEKVDPKIFRKLSRNLKNGIILVTGTNGKTTTSKMITEILEADGQKVVNNSGGSNLTRGIVSALISESSLFGKIKKDVGVYEVDEATMPKVAKMIEPKMIAVTNIFRDQLDRYGEVDKTAAILKEAISKHPDTILILNADDPIVATLAEKHRKTVFFGINDKKIEAQSDLARDLHDCPLCSNELIYKNRYYGHIGIYICKECKFARPKPNFSADNIRFARDEICSSIFFKEKKENLSLPMSGLYNLYNALTAIAATHTLGAKEDIILHSLESLTPAFGRMERFTAEGKETSIHLVKNPTGFNQVLENLAHGQPLDTLFLVLNDNFADGTDISWIWDTEMELIQNSFRKVIISGIRMEDLALRLKYAGVPTEKVIQEKNIDKALAKATTETHEGENLYILPTYTAMLSIRNTLVRKGFLDNYWDAK